MLLNLRPLLRLLRKRLFLAFVFGCSLTYFLISMLREKRPTNPFDGHDYDELSKNLDIDKVKMRLINIKRSQMMNALNKDGKYVGSGGEFPVNNQDQLRHDPNVNDHKKEAEADENNFHLDLNFTMLKPGDNCRNSVQGKIFITDDRGYTCNRSDLTVGGCCPQNESLSKLYSCETCQSNGCCRVYEYCISCCMEPAKQSLLRKIIAKPGVGVLLFASVTDPFEICLTKCRTSSESVHHENSYKDPNAKYCYGESGAPSNTALRRRNKEDEVSNNQNNEVHAQDFGT